MTVRKPGSTPERVQTLRSSTPAPITSATANATSATTRGLRGSAESRGRSRRRGRPAPALALEVEPAAPRQRCEPEHGRRRHGHGRGEREHPQVDRGLSQARDVAGGERDQQAQPAEGERQRRGGAEGGERRALDQELTRDTSPSSPQRPPDGQLPGAHGGACEHQVGDVDAGDQEDHRGGAEQHQERRPDRAEGHQVVGLEVRAAAGVLRVGVLEDPGDDAGQLPLGGRREVPGASRPTVRNGWV